MLRRTLLMALACGFAATGARAHSYVLGSVEIDFQDKNLVEQGFKFRPLNAATDQCGCGESFTAVKSRA